MNKALASPRAASVPVSAWLYGALGMLVFSGSLPATRLAVRWLDPIFLTTARAAIAGLIAAVLLLALRQRRPVGAEWGALALTAGGIVLGFPLLTALALRKVESSHAIVFTALLPCATALAGVLRTGDRPRPAFWLFSLLGAAIVAAYALQAGSALSLRGDGLMLGAIAVCGMGYAEGARLSRRLGSWQVICWALVLSLPVSLAFSALCWPAEPSRVALPAWGALAYVSLFSMLIGFFFWYRGLASGGVARIGQIQLLQPFCALLLASTLLGEHIDPLMLYASVLVVACVAGSRRFA